MYISIIYGDTNNYYNYRFNPMESNHRDGPADHKNL